MSFKSNMNVNTKNISFQARSPRIREAEKICRYVTSEFSSISASKMRSFDSVAKESRFPKAISRIQNNIENLIRIPAIEHKDVFKFYQYIVDAVKKHKVANCGELSSLACLIGWVNNFKPIEAHLYAVSKKYGRRNSIDHSNILLPLDGEVIKGEDLYSNMKKVLVIDPWLGFVDFAPNAELRYKNEFSKFLYIPEEAKLLGSKLYNPFSRMSEAELNYLKKQFKDLVFK